ncbi:hypothetical protein AB3S75_042812 [Citrus x aurantiifolia]
MDFDVGIEDVGIAVLQELWNRVALQAVDIASETRDVVLGKDSLQGFSRTFALETLGAQLREAHNIIDNYKSRSRLRLLLQSNSVLSRMQHLAREIAITISSFQLVNLEIALNLKAMTDQIVDSLRSMEFQSAAAAEAIASEIERSALQNNKNRENALELLRKIAEAVGASVNASLVQTELELLKQEKEELEAEKKQAEALQLTQLMQLLYSTELVRRPQDETIPTYCQVYPIESLVCPLCNELMEDPVAIVCGHSFERKAIQEHFQRGRKNCPTCRQELLSLDLMPNLSLRSSIEEWKQREIDLRFQNAIIKINSDDQSRRKCALEEMKNIMELPQYAEKAAKGGLIPKLVEFLKDTRLSTEAILKCLYFLAKYSDIHKEAIVEAGAVRRIVKQICKEPFQQHTLCCQNGRSWILSTICCLLQSRISRNSSFDGFSLEKHATR